jgi:hypothetical protein
MPTQMFGERTEVMLKTDFWRKWAVLLLAMVLVAACSDDESGSLESAVEAAPEAVRLPYQELYDQGADRYLGEYTPMLSTEADDSIIHQFGAGDGPLCLDGSEYEMSTRDLGSEDLLIFLEGGGACWPVLCAATENADASLTGEGAKSGILDPTSELNPVKDWNVAYVPYCDGSIFGGNVDYDIDEDGIDDRFHRGLKNLSAAVDVTAHTFPQPRRIVIAGTSGGGYGTFSALPLVRRLYPDVPIEVINDSGLGAAPAGDPTASSVLEYWNSFSLVPESCADCLSEGNATGLFNWLMGEDENLRLAALSYKQDFTIGTFYTGLGDVAFEELLLASMSAVESENPERFRSFLKDGGAHTLLRSLSESIDGVTLSQWLSNFLYETEAWVTVIED